MGTYTLMKNIDETIYPDLQLEKAISLWPRHLDLQAKGLTSWSSITSQQHIHPTTIVPSPALNSEIERRRVILF